MESCSAIIVTFNNAATIAGCLETLGSQVDEIIVFDNASKDSTTQIVASQFPKVTILSSDKNIGYGAAVNKASKSVTSDLILVANADVTFSANTFAELSQLMSQSSCGIVGPVIENTDGTRYPSPRLFPRFSDAVGHGFVGLFTTNNPWSKRYLRNTESIDSSQSVDWVSGSCMLIRKHTFDELNGFDEQFFMYMEDVDLCRRAHELGWQVWFAANARVVHIQGASTATRPLRSIVSHHRSLFKYVNVATGGPARALLPVVWLGIGVRMLLMLGKTALNR